MNERTNITTSRRSGLSGMIIKAMGMFTGVQCLQIICSIVRNKLVSLWLGAAGVGLLGVFNQALDTFYALSQLGLRNSMQPALSRARGREAFSRLCCVIKRWYSVLALIGAVLMIALSGWLSRVTFGDSSQSTSFVILSVCVFLSGISNGQLGILQASQMLSRLAKASAWGALGGLVASIPLYYFFGLQSVAPSLAVMSLATLVATFYFRARVSTPEKLPTPRETFSEGLDIIRLGVFMISSVFFTLLVNYVFYVWLNRNTDIETVGLYQSGFTIINRYIGLVFSAIAMEYYPRLCRVASSDKRTSMFVGHEMLIALIVILPMATIMAAADDLLLRLFYDSRFEVAAPFISWGLTGTAFRAISWCMVFVILARGDGITYIICEVLSTVTSLALNIIFFCNWGLAGLGVAYTLWFMAYTIIVGVVYFCKYRLTLSRRLIAFASLTVIIILLSAVLRELGYRWPVIAIALISAVWSLTMLKKLLKRQ